MVVDGVGGGAGESHGQQPQLRDQRSRQLLAMAFNTPSSEFLTKSFGKSFALFLYSAATNTYH